MSWTNKPGGRSPLRHYKRAARRCGDYFPFRTGQMVRREDGRHTGRVSSIHYNMVNVIWLDSNWRSTEWPDDLVAAEQPDSEIIVIQGL